MKCSKGLSLDRACPNSIQQVIHKSSRVNECVGDVIIRYDVEFGMLCRLRLETQRSEQFVTDPYKVHLEICSQVKNGLKQTSKEWGVGPISFRAHHSHEYPVPFSLPNPSVKAPFQITFCPHSETLSNTKKQLQDIPFLLPVSLFPLF